MILYRSQGSDVLSWEGNRGSGIALALRHRFQCFIELWADRLWRWAVHQHCSWSVLLYTAVEELVYHGRRHQNVTLEMLCVQLFHYCVSCILHNLHSEFYWIGDGCLRSCILLFPLPQVCAKCVFVNSCKYSCITAWHWFQEDFPSRYFLNHLCSFCYLVVIFANHLSLDNGRSTKGKNSVLYVA